DPNGIAHQSDPPTTATETIHHILNEQANDNTTQPRAGPQNTDNSNTEQTHDDSENRTAGRHGVNGRGEAHGTADAA
ncbi:hypothetical protein, partial [Phytoactinopolyspora endophytica]|uniref:hypothetical protein n=1 Tax=Phytoactinopolyspora endophytica TaxID=1642495 RepID=UPI00197C055B